VLLRSLSQINFRNLVTPRLEFTPGITAIVGQNAAGKSNVLDAVYLGCSATLPAGHLADTIRLGESEGFVGVKVERCDGVISVEVGLAPGRKTIRLDGQTVRTLELARVSAAVLITPEDSDLIHGSPSGRRGYLDSLLGRLSLRYAMLLREYSRVVEQRNALLKSSYDADSLAIWSDRFVILGTEIMALRQRAITRIADIAAATYKDIAGSSKQLDVRLSNDAQTALKDQLSASAAEERARGMTVVGPHRDDLILELDNLNVQTFGSRGEARTTALALRVAEYRLLEEKHGEAPVLLLDDFTAELDADRRSYLLALAARAPQAIVSGTETPPQSERLYAIHEGRLYAR
jgi:DNA replication and repair protein RecF